MLRILSALRLHLLDQMPLSHIFNELFGLLRNWSVGKLAVGRASHGLFVPLVMIEIYIVQQLHQLGAPQINVIDALQEEENHVLHFFSRIGHRHPPHKHYTTSQLIECVNSGLPFRRWFGGRQSYRPPIKYFRPGSAAD